MIPRKIHYCWFGGKPYPRLVEKCMESWQKFCPDYEITRWDASNAPLDEGIYVQQAYQAEQWAFVSDYVRLRVLEEQGGIYLDTDVELLDSLDAFLYHDFFLGFESVQELATCLLASVPGHPLIRQLSECYQGIRFLCEDGSYDRTTNVKRVTAFFLQKGLIADGSFQTVEDAVIYPQDYFSPKDLATGKIRLTKHTRAIHHFGASWMTSRQRFHMRIAQWIGPEWTKRIKGGRKHEG